MDRFFDEMARALGKPMSRRSAFKTLAQLLGGAALVALSPRRAAAAAACGTTNNVTVTGFTGSNQKCNGGNPNGSLQNAWAASSPVTCSGNASCPTQTVSNVTCTGGDCSSASPCSVTGTVKCACGSGTCASGNCCCITNGTCQPSVGGSGNCRTGHSGC